MSKSAWIEYPYIPATRTRFVQPGKIEIDANERAVIEEFKAAFSFAPPSILSLTICNLFRITVWYGACCICRSNSIYGTGLFPALCFWRFNAGIDISGQ